MSCEEENKRFKFFLVSLLLKCDDLSCENRGYTMSYAVEEEIRNILEEFAGQKSESSGLND